MIKIVRGSLLNNKVVYGFIDGKVVIIVFKINRNIVLGVRIDEINR